MAFDNEPRCEQNRDKWVRHILSSGSEELHDLPKASELRYCSEHLASDNSLKGCENGPIHVRRRANGPVGHDNMDRFRTCVYSRKCRDLLGVAL